MIDAGDIRRGDDAQRLAAAAQQYRLRVGDAAAGLVDDGEAQLRQRASLAQLSFQPEEGGERF